MASLTSTPDGATNPADRFPFRNATGHWSTAWTGRPFAMTTHDTVPLTAFRPAIRPLAIPRRPPFPLLMLKYQCKASDRGFGGLH